MFYSNEIPAWYYGEEHVTAKDVEVLIALAAQVPSCGPLLLTGEVAVSRIGDVGMRAITKANMLLDEAILSQPPLFQVTHYGTVRMTRYQHTEDAPKSTAVWDCLTDNTVRTLFEQETRWMGLRYWTLDTKEFYSGLFTAEGLWSNRAISDNRRADMYITALLCFGKTTFLDYTFGSFFSAHSFTKTRFEPLSEAQKSEADRVFNPNTKYLTFNEVDFIGRMTEKI